MNSAPRIILADDDLFIHRLAPLAIARALSHPRLRLVCYGSEALALYQHEGADLIITDNIMPLMSGIELTMHLRSMGSTVPVILISSYPAFEMEALQAGASYFVAKSELNTRLPPLLTQLFPRGARSPGPLRQQMSSSQATGPLPDFLA